MDAEEIEARYDMKAIRPAAMKCGIKTRCVKKLGEKQVST
jgi:hypothetical protein